MEDRQSKIAIVCNSPCLLADECRLCEWHQLTCLRHLTIPARSKVHTVCGKDVANLKIPHRWDTSDWIPHGRDTTFVDTTYMRYRTSSNVHIDKSKNGSQQELPYWDYFKANNFTLRALLAFSPIYFGSRGGPVLSQDKLFWKLPSPLMVFTKKCTVPPRQFRVHSW